MSLFIDTSALYALLDGDEPKHSAAAVASLFTAARRRLSLVDCTSFELMRRLGLTDVLALDTGFARQGFNLLPASRA